MGGWCRKTPPCDCHRGPPKFGGEQNFSKKIIKNKYLMELMGIYRIFLATFGGRFFKGGSFLTQNFGPGVCVLTGYHREMSMYGRYRNKRKVFLFDREKKSTCIYRYL